MVLEGRQPEVTRKDLNCADGLASVFSMLVPTALASETKKPCMGRALSFEFWSGEGNRTCHVNIVIAGGL